MSATTTPGPVRTAAGRGRGPARALGTWGAARLVAAREIAVRLRDRAFLISTAIGLVIIAASIVVPALLLDGDGAQERTVATTGAGASQLVTDLEGSALTVDVLDARDDAAAEALVSEGTADAALLPAPGGGWVLVGDEDVPSDLAEALTASLSSQQLTAVLDELGADDAQRAAATAVPLETRVLDADGVTGQVTIIAIVFALLFFFTVYTYGYQIAQSVTEEKQSRVVELLVAAVPVRALLVGKVLGSTLIALAQIVLILAVGLVALAATGQGSLIGVVTGASGWFVVFFLLGFTMLSTLWAAAGALAARIEDLQSTTAPLQLLVMAPFFAALYLTTPGTALTALSYIPFTAPLSMPRRLLLGDAAWWEALLSAGLIAGVTALLVVLAERLYRGSLLRTGTKTSVKQAWALGADA